MARYDIPKLGFPFRPSFYTEQGSLDEAADRIEVLITTHIGEREAVPSYGVPDYTFRQNGVDIGQLEGIISEWEPEAAAVLERDELLNLIDRIRVKVTGGRI